MIKWLEIDYCYMTPESCDEDGSVRVHGMLVYKVTPSKLIK